MEQYISKAALVAEINRLQEATMDKNQNFLSSYHEGIFDGLSMLENFLDTLEVKEGDLENSIVCEAKWHDGFLLDYTQEQQDALLEKIGVNVGDKVRVMLIKEK